MIAKKIKSGDYEDKIRIASYKAYSHPEFAAKVRNINALNKLTILPELSRRKEMKFLCS